MISVLILTKNEEQNLPRCLESVRWSPDVLVFDSYSTDRTVEVARAAGARVIQHAFVSYGLQREAARQLGQYRFPWVLALDADETPDPELVAELQAVAREDCTPHAAFRMRRKDHFMGRWIKHSTLYPSWFVRFYRHDRIHYEPRHVHEYPTVPGSLGELHGHLLHENFSKGFDEWWSRHISYAAFEAQDDLAALGLPLFGNSKLNLHDPVTRRHLLKSVSMRLPFRPKLRFFYMYLLRGGILDGKAGYHYCRLLAKYEFMIVLMLKELRLRRAGLSF